MPDDPSKLTYSVRCLSDALVDRQRSVVGLGGVGLAEVVRYVLRSQIADIGDTVMQFKLVLACAVSALLLASGLAPAHAQDVRRVDARGDAPAGIDIRSAKYSHSSNRVSVVAKIPSLGKSGEGSLSISRFTIFEAGYVVLIKKRAGHKARVRLTYFNHFDLEPRECPGITGRWTEAQVKLSVPRACLKGHARKKVFAQFGIQRQSKIDRAPAVRRLSRS